MVRAVGRAAVPGDPYLLRGLLVCVLCGRLMVSGCGTDGTRRYACLPACRQPDLHAEPAESDMLLGALIRCVVTRHPEFGRTQQGDPGDPESWSHGPAVSVEEMRRWTRCDVRDRRAVLLTAYSRVVVNPEGRLRPVWRQVRQPTAELAEAGP